MYSLYHAQKTISEMIGINPNSIVALRMEDGSGFKWLYTIYQQKEAFIELPQLCFRD